MSDQSDRSETPPASVRLIEALVCPATGGRLTYDPDRQELISKVGQHRLPDPLRHPDHADRRGTHAGGLISLKECSHHMADLPGCV